MNLLRTYIDRGYSVVPCHRGTGTDLDKRPCIPSWKPYQDRIASDTELASWALQFPECNVAIVTGEISGIVVLDVDSSTGHEIVMSQGDFPETPCVETASGYHLYFKHPGVRTRNFVKGLPGSDFRGDGGYVLGAGSKHPSGKLYRWLQHASSEPLPVPEWLMPFILPTIIATRADRPPMPRRADVGDWASAALRRERIRLESIPLAEGNGKNQAFFMSAIRLGQLIGAGLLDETLVRVELLSIWGRWGKPSHEGEATLESGLTRGKREPRYPADRGRAAR